MFEKLSSKIKK